MTPLLSAKDSLYLKCNQNALPEKGWQAIWLRSSVFIIVCDRRTVSNCALDSRPLFSEKTLESWHVLPKVSCRRYSQPCCKAPGHLRVQPICALEDAVSFSPQLWKILFSFLYFPLGLFESCSGFQMTLSQKYYSSDSGN